jgi:hypothetical protein
VSRPSATATERARLPAVGIMPAIAAIATGSTEPNDTSTLHPSASEKIGRAMTCAHRIHNIAR